MAVLKNGEIFSDLQESVKAKNKVCRKQLEALKRHKNVMP